MAGGTEYVRVLIEGDEKVALGLEREAEAAADLSPALELVADDMMRVELKTFEGQGRRYGGSWHALDPDWVKEKVKKGLDPRILIATHKLMDSMSLRGDSNQELIITPHTVELSSRLDYGGIQQHGSEHIPARPFVEIYPQDKKRWADIILHELELAMALV